MFNENDGYIKALGKAIKFFRKKACLTQFDLAIQSDMEENALQRIEAGRTNPTIKTLLKIVIALDIKLSELLGVAEQEME